MLLDNLLAILPEKIGDVLAERRLVSVEDVDIEEAMNRRATKFNNVKGDIAVIPVYGYISHRASIYSALGLETSSETLGQWIDAVMQNPSVGAVVFDVNSPGGSAVGLTSVSDKIFSYRGTKPMVAVSNGIMASAAYFIGSSADEIVADPDSLTGSVGTIMVHTDYSKYLEEMGVDITIIKAGKYKAEGNPYEPLGDEAKASLQETVDSYYDSFVSAVARNRGVTASKVKSDFGQGRVFRASKAKEVGMIDRVGTLESVMQDMMPKQNKNRMRNEAYGLKAKSLKMQITSEAKAL